MRKTYFTFTLAIAGLLFAAGVNTALAETPRLVFNLGQDTQPVSQSEVANWQSAQIVEPNKIFSQRPENLKNSIYNFSGKKTETQSGTRFYNYNLAAIYDYVKKMAETINVPVTEPELEIQNNVLVKFTAPQDGVDTDIVKTAFDALTALQVGRKEVETVVYKTSPKRSLGSLNNLGINELIAHGVSTFGGSPKNRRHNIAVGTQKFKGLLIKPGEEFSFNKFLGPVEAQNGFLPELVIKKSGTVPELGGGLCQVSSTAFRAAMEAGLPITQRRNHAYAVQYYAPQGTDATIYPGVIDLKFINDTPGAILIWAYQKDNNTLIFDFYGTKDGREVTLQKPVQYDRKPDGSLKASWTRQVVSASGEKRTDEFKSVYQSPDLFHKTEQFVTAPATTPTSTPSGLQIQ